MLQGQIDAANLQNRVRLLGFRDDVHAVVAAADLFVLPSLAEPFGLVLLEAMALSRPVVATAAGGPLEIVAEPRTGRLVPPADAAALATAMREILADPDAAAATGRAGRLRFERHFTRRNMAEKTLGVYRACRRKEPRVSDDSPRPLRVLLISNTCQSRRKGLPKAEALGRRGDVDLHVLVPDRWFEKSVGWVRAEEPLPGASFAWHCHRVRLPWAGPLQVYLHHYPKLAALLREVRPDVIDVWSEPWGLAARQVVRLRDGLLPRSAVIAETEQNIDKWMPPPFPRWRKTVLRGADYLIGRSGEAVEVCRRHGYGGPARVVPNAVDAELFRPMDRGACRAALEAEVGVALPFVVGYAGRLVEEKGLQDLIEAAAACDREVHVVLVGGGDFEPHLRAAAADPKLAGRAHFLPGRPLEELPALFNAFDLFCLPSRTTPTWKEQFGRVIIEAQACETPVLGTDSGAIAEVIDDGGEIVPERDPAALAAAVEKLRRNPARLHEAGAAGRRRVLTRYTWTRVAQVMADVYAQAVRTKAP